MLFLLLLLFLKESLLLIDSYQYVKNKQTDKLQILLLSGGLRHLPGMLTLFSKELSGKQAAVLHVLPSDLCTKLLWRCTLIKQESAQKANEIQRL